MFFFSTYADLIEFLWILVSPLLPVRYYFNLDNFLNPPLSKNGNIKFHINSVSIQLTWSIFLEFFQNKIIDEKSEDGALWSILCSILPYILRIKKKL